MSGLKRLGAGLPPVLIDVKALATKYVEASPLFRAQVIRDGVWAVAVPNVIASMKISTKQFYLWTRLSQSAVDDGVGRSTRLDQPASETVFGVIALIGAVQRNADKPRGPRNAASWLGGWLLKPYDAVLERQRGDYIDTAEGRELLRKLLEHDPTDKRLD
jgi:hypothetical protein